MLLFESAGREFVWVVGHFGLTVSIPKTEGLAMGAVLSKSGVSLVEVEGGVIKMVKFYLFWF